MTGTAEQLMRRALVLARRGLGRVEPNPMVGALLARRGQVLAEGFHQRFGGPHAEINALEQARRRSIDPAGCDMFVTLEPCSHHGQTPPCTDALIAARPGRLFIAMTDPNPQVASAGIAALRAAGIDVQLGLCETQAQQLNESYLKRITTAMPWTIAKWAQTLDGFIATADGDSKWISNVKSRRRVHQLRARVDAIVVGIGTAVADDPQLTARDVPLRRIARRVIVDPNLRLPASAAVFADIDNVPLILAVRQELLHQKPAKLGEFESRGVEFVGLNPQSNNQNDTDCCDGNSGIG